MHSKKHSPRRTFLLAAIALLLALVAHHGWKDLLAFRRLNSVAPLRLAQSEGQGLAPGLTDNAPADIPDYATVARILAEQLPGIHLLRQPLDEGKSALAWTNYLAALDYERIYFRQQDIDSFEPARLELHSSLRQGDLSFADLAFETYLQRVAERVAFVENILEGDFDFSIDETYHWKRREAPWLADAKAQDDLWRKRIKNELLARQVSRELKAAKDEADKGDAEQAEATDEPETPAADDEKETAPPAATEPTTEDAADQDLTEGAPAAKPAEKPVDDKEFVRKRYQQYLTMLQDSDAEHRMTRFLSAATAAFDPHTSYLSPVSLEDFGINMQLSLQGIGAQLTTDDGAAKIEEIIPGGPADRDVRDIRLVKGDRIIGVGQGDEDIVDTLHWPLYKTVRLIRGPKGTKVVLLVQPASDPSGMTTKIVDLIRDEVKLEESAATSRIETPTDAEGRERRLGTIRLPTFYASMNLGQNDAEHRSASLDIARLLADLNSQKVEGLVLDLRGNGGGALKEAIDLTGLFIRTGPVVLVKEGTRIHLLPDQDPAVAFRLPMIVLIDRISASASEIVAGALQDYGRAVIVGDSRSHGKGTVQQIIPLGDAGKLGSIKVTNASFFRINGSSTQVKGVSSDIVLPSAFDYFADLGEDKLPNPIPWSTVPPARYSLVSHLEPVIAQLKQRSETRLEDDERWLRHLRRMKRIERASNLVEVPLEIGQRREFARAERDLDELDEDLSLENATRKEREEARRKRDVVMDEALQILIDLIDIQGPVENLQPQTDRNFDSIFDRLFR